MDASLQKLLEMLDVEELEKNYFRGYSPTQRTGRIFGGQVLGQALMAAGRTVDATRPVHSLQASFLLGGKPEIPIMYEVDRIRDGRSFTTRRVRAFQHGEAIFALSASFHVVEDGPSHQDPMPEAPGPDHPDAIIFGRDWGMPIDARLLDGNGPAGPMQFMWMRSPIALNDDPLLHATILAYASDLALVSVIARPHSDQPWPSGFMMASLDHMIWFHRPFRVDDWLLYARRSPSAHGARGLALGSIYTQDGTLVASVAQEGLVRPVTS